MDQPVNNKMTWKTILSRGIKRRCPKCGQGKVLKGYLTQEKSCTNCDEDLENIRADDGPAWMTILLTGHLLAPFIHYAIMHDSFPLQYELPIILAIATVTALALLPFCKGIFIAIIWFTRQKD
ncbi:MAG: hypothetical protein CL561_01760 [Alphaproteobacteria bacterium]|nr:hypothetical protein [Alphaproteobacteria bacterium]|tara:strand:- start:1816 stop:2184 length:369 start_codon:yes stop_codon:yes gene_type:complete